MKKVQIFIDRDSNYDFTFTKRRGGLSRWTGVIPEEKYEELERITNDYYIKVQDYLREIVEEGINARQRKKKTNKEV